VDDDAFKYLINKPQLSGCITKWFILLQEYIYKKWFGQEKTLLQNVGAVH
jgi:hypothetical protein